jgi:hypothetical protein
MTEEEVLLGGRDKEFPELPSPKARGYSIINKINKIIIFRCIWYRISLSYTIDYYV